MGSFSFMKADNMTKVANIVTGAPFKFLIPTEFGGGYIKDYYQDYGYLDLRKNNKGEIEPKYDLHELLAVWNYKWLNEYNKKDKVIVRQLPNGKLNMMPEIGKDTMKNRSAGIDLFFF